MKPILVSGIQPSGRLHIGNYLGALKNFVELQNSGKYQCYFFIADLHSLTEPYEPKEKSRQVLELFADYLAAGLNPKKSMLFLQSQIPAHSELMWILSTVTSLGDLERMTQFKEKSKIRDHLEILTKYFKDNIKKYGEFLMENLIDQLAGKTVSMQDRDRLNNILLAVIAESNLVREKTSAGLLNYPILMAADILLYDAKFVPVGDDQDQHLELTRTLARKFNARFPAHRSSGSEGGGKTFIEPQALHTAIPRVMSLANPMKKMSKSVPESCLFLDDEPETIKKKIARAVTDSGSEVKYDPKHKAGISNLLGIYSALSGEPVQKLEKRFSGKTYSVFKESLAKTIAGHFADFRKRKKALTAKSSQLKAILISGSKKAAVVANKKIAEVKKKVGIAI